MTSKIIYIAGPMTGLSGFNRSSFNRAALSLEIDGFEVRNPACLPHGWANYEHYIEVGLAMLGQCDIIAFLPGSDQSKGAKREAEFANKSGIKLRQDLLGPVWEDLVADWTANGGRL